MLKWVRSYVKTADGAPSVSLISKGHARNAGELGRTAVGVKVSSKSISLPLNRVFISLCWLWMLASSSYAQEDEIIAGGKGKYIKYCASCHGQAAKGDGPLAQMLSVKPADLTQLSKRNEEQFPFWRVYRMIDGREEVRGHGSREMPMWGFIFQIEEGATAAPYQEDLVRGRIWQLVYFLESIQEK